MKMDGCFAGQPKKSGHNNRKVTYHRGGRKAGFHCRKTNHNIFLSVIILVILIILMLKGEY